MSRKEANRGKSDIPGCLFHLRRRYKIGQKEFDALLAEQGGVCAICGAPSPEHVDHDHVFGNVRGILCFNSSATVA
jgi:hypothetical protein